MEELSGSSWLSSVETFLRKIEVKMSTWNNYFPGFDPILLGLNEFRILEIGHIWSAALDSK